MTYAFIHTVKFFIVTAFLFVLFFMITGSRANAYFTTGQEAFALDTHSVLFSIDYVFGHSKNEVYMPVLAERKEGTDNTVVPYEILDADGNKVLGKVSGIVFSDARLTKEAMYLTSSNIAQKFTLAVIFTPDVPKEGEKYRLQVTYLPFSFNGTHQLQLNPSELKYYTTKYISLD